MYLAGAVTSAPEHIGASHLSNGEYTVLFSFDQSFSHLF